MNYVNAQGVLHQYSFNIKIRRKGTKYEGMEWIHLAQDRDQWRAPVNTVMDLRIS
jgi:hypothetical protein